MRREAKSLEKGELDSARGLTALVRLSPLLLALVGGCAGHESRVKAALEALDRGQPQEAVAALNEELEVDSAEQLPNLQDDNALLLLDRATIQQSLGRFKLSQRDFGAADKAIDVLDMKHSTADDIGKYLFSDDVGPYRAAPYEKLLLNSFNMMNYLARGDLSGARVEARRLAIMQGYLKDQGEDTSLIGLGSYLAGLTFEKSGRKDEALNHYREALHYKRYLSLVEPLKRLTGGEPDSPDIDALVQGQSATLGDSAEVIIVSAYGRVPQKIPERIPIGVALTLVSGSISPHDHDRANEMAAKGLVTWINFPRLGKAHGRYSIPQLAVDGRAVPFEYAIDIEGEVRSHWEANEGTVILAAITRMITRVAAGEVVQAATSEIADDNIIGLLAGLAASATLSAVDTPDTRAWSTLPSNVAVTRITVPAGRHFVDIAARGTHERHEVEVQPGGWAFVVSSVLY